MSVLSLELVALPQVAKYIINAGLNQQQCCQQGDS